VPDDAVGVSAMAVLRELRLGVGRARSSLEDALEEIRRAFNEDRGQGAEEVDPWATLADVERQLFQLRTDLEAARVAEALLVPVSDEPAPPTAEDARAAHTGAADVRGRARLFDPLAETMSATTYRRMSEIAETLRLSDAQAVERCVATQHYVDARLREGWQFFIRRGRERRAVSFPGQAAA
jgi:hypothetical protein